MITDILDTVTSEELIKWANAIHEADKSLGLWIHHSITGVNLRAFNGLVEEGWREDPPLIMTTSHCMARVTRIATKFSIDIHAKAIIRSI